MINKTFCYFFSPESRDDQLARLGCLITVTGDDGQQTDETVDCRQSVLQTSESLSLSLSLSRQAGLSRFRAPLAHRHYITNIIILGQSPHFYPENTLTAASDVECFVSESELSFTYFVGILAAQQ